MELFGPTSEQILRKLDEMQDDHELLVQEDKILEERRSEFSPQGASYKKSPQS